MLNLKDYQVSFLGLKRPERDVEYLLPPTKSVELQRPPRYAFMARPVAILYMNFTFKSKMALCLWAGEGDKQQHAKHSETCGSQNAVDGD